MTAPVALREIRESDVAILFAQQDDPEANEMAAFPARGETAYREHMARVLATPSSLIWAVVVGDDVVGQVCSWDADGIREVGYWIGREYWGNGYATAAVRQLVEKDPARPMWAEIAEHNIGSQRVVERCGFVFVREVREDVLMRIYRLDDVSADM
jgi:RimJ/RimL family protein N-acetyltransferase